MSLELSSCVKIYSPHIKGSDTSKYVISGQVTMGNQTQTVNVSKTSPISSPTYKPVKGCQVTIRDNQNHSFSMVDLGNGSYSTMVDPQYLVPGHVFRVSVITPDGDSIISDYDTLHQVPPVDSIHYSIKKVTSSTGLSTEGLQFYVDLKGTNTDSRYYRWAIYETWEYHAAYPIVYYYSYPLILHHNIPPDSSKFTCWDTRRIPKIFTLSTKNLSQNKYNSLPLQYVDNTTQKLFNGYSMLVEQFALSKAAYNYWSQMQAHSTQEGGLYEKQPLAIRGNLRDITHPNKEVLGFFTAESVSYKRIFIRRVPGLPLKYVTPCSEHPLKLIPTDKSFFPIYLKADKGGKNTGIELSVYCVNCLLQGGDTIKPSFWPK